MLFYIIGMPGAGRRKLGSELAESLGVDYQAVNSAVDATLQNGVVALIGLTPLSERDMALMKTGKVIYLYRSPEQLWEDASTENLSILKDKDYQFFCGLFEEYEDLFIKCADFLVYNDGFSRTAFRDARTFCQNSIALERL